jgi:hypothetical protein
MVTKLVGIITLPDTERIMEIFDLRDQDMVIMIFWKKYQSINR